MSTSHSTKVIRWRDNQLTELTDQLAVEEPLEIRLAFVDPRKGPTHKSVSITMRTPGDDLALALGFLHSESIIRNMQDVKAMEQTNENVVRIALSDETTFDMQRLERHFYTTSSCGVCGKSSLESLSTAGFSALHDTGFRVYMQTLYQLSDKLSSQQTLFKITGGNHATALFDQQGKISLVTEDVGRHNAMDKLVGRLLQAGKLPLQQHGMMVSGRASFELMQKALAASCPLVVAVGAPSSLAVELAQEYNITLVGFLSGKGCNIYHGAFRLSV